MSDARHDTARGHVGAYLQVCEERDAALAALARVRAENAGRRNASDSDRVRFRRAGALDGPEGEIVSATLCRDGIHEADGGCCPVRDAELSITVRADDEGEPIYERSEATDERLAAENRSLRGAITTWQRQYDIHGWAHDRAEKAEAALAVERDERFTLEEALTEAEVALDRVRALCDVSEATASRGNDAGHLGASSSCVPVHALRTALDGPGE